MKDKKKSILVYKSYGGLGDILFAIPSVQLLTQKFETVTFAIHSRLVNLFKIHVNQVVIEDENLVDPNIYDEVIELGNYPWFKNDLERLPQIAYPTHKRKRQHAIGHYKDGIIAKFNDIINIDKSYPYFNFKPSDELYYTIHPGAGFLLKTWPLEYFAALIELIYEYFPNLKVKIVIGPNDPDPVPLLKNSKVSYEKITGNIEAVANAVSGAQFHIGNDAGITHLASAFNKPVLAIYGPTGPGSWGPFSQNVEFIWGKKGNCNLACNYNVIINCEDRVCLKNVVPNMLFFKLLNLLKRIGKPNSNSCYINPDYSFEYDKDAFIFKSKTQEYLLEIKDKQSQEFLLELLQEKNPSLKNLPPQFQETFSALESLQVLATIPEIIK